MAKAKKGKAGRPAFKPTEEQRATVRAMAAYGVPEDDIAKVIGTSGPTLRKHFRHELDTAHAEANAKVAQSLYNKATGDGPNAVTAAIFWLKTRAGWKDVTSHEHTGKDGGPIEFSFKLDSPARDAA